MARTSEGSRASAGTHRRAAADPPAFRPSAADVVAAIEGLYADEVRPHGRILLKRLGERAASKAAAACFATVSHPNLVQNVPRIDAGRLRRVCQGCRQLRVEPEESGEYCALLAGRRETFVDSSLDVDEYPEQLWFAASAFFAGPLAAELVLPGGRYACAQALVSLGLPFLAGLSLGRVCHVVQLAISRRRLLGYLSGQVVPYARSEAVVKEVCARQQQAVVLGARAVPDLPLATLEQARLCLQEMLTGEAAEPVAVPLPNVKRLFRSRFGLDLSETALGHARLCELLQDACFRDVCDVRLRGNGYVVVRAERERALAPPSPEPWPAYEYQPAAQAALAAPAHSVRAAPCSPEARARSGAPPTPETWPTYELKLADRLAGPAAPPPTGPPPCPPPCLPPMFYGLPAECLSTRPPRPPTSSKGEGARAACAASDSDATESTAEGAAEDQSDCTGSAAEEEPRPASCVPQWPSEWAVGDVFDAELRRGDEIPASARRGLLAEPLGGPPGLGLGSEPGMPEQASTPLVLQNGHWSALMSPAELAGDPRVGHRVKNTFVHLSPAKATPIGTGARRRACSVPRDAGSSRDPWAALVPGCDTVLFRPEGAASPAYIVASPALRAAQASAQAPAACWSPGSPGGGVAEALRLWGCALPEPAPEAAACLAPWRPRARA